MCVNLHFRYNELPILGILNLNQQGNNTFELFNNDATYNLQRLEDINYKELYKSKLTTFLYKSVQKKIKIFN